MKKNLRKVSIALNLISILHMTMSLPANADSATFTRPGGPGERPDAGNDPRPGGPRNPGDRPRPNPTDQPTGAPSERPNPRPTFVPQPQPQPQPQPSPTPTPVNTAQAKNDGLNDGQTDGGREGRERGPSEGEREGRYDGQREGFERCAKEESERARERGYSEGYREGSYHGREDGSARGSAEGQQRGEADGRADGQQRADRDAYNASTPLGSAKGYEQANGSDAAARGNADGLIVGDQQALSQAQRVDYPKGHKSYYDERFAEDVKYFDSFSQRGSSRASVSSLLGGNSESGKLQADHRDDDGDRRGGGDRGSHGNATPDFRYNNPRRSYLTPEENSAYRSAYSQGYGSGFQTEYDAVYQNAYRQAFRYGMEHGCEDARRRDYRDDYQRGFVAGRDTGYRENYQPSYDAAYRGVYGPIFQSASENAYRATYPGAYDRHFEEARASAYASRVNQLYGDAKEAARQQKFNQAYPVYADQQLRKGRADEAQDFADRPVRLLEATATETTGNDLFEPGEPLRVKVKLRNFSGSALNGKDISLKIEAYDSSSAIISQAQTTLVRNLRDKSVTDVSDALEFQMSESTVNRVSRFKVTAFYQGRNVGNETIEVRTQFMITMELAERPEFKDGLPMPLRVRLTNQSSRATDPTIKIKLVAPSDKLDIQNAEQVVAGIDPGQSRVVEFTVVAHTASPTLYVPLGFSVTGGTGRRIGLLDLTNEVPVVNDYRIMLAASAGSLQHAGVARMYYQVRNVSSRLLFKGLQLRVSFKETDNVDNFKVIGPNPQYLMPLEKGESTSFVVPVLVKEENRGGTLVLELQEDGRTVVTHEVEFRKTLN